MKNKINKTIFPKNSLTFETDFMKNLFRQNVLEYNKY